MHTERLRKIQPPSRVQQLLDSFVMETQAIAESGTRIRDRTALPSPLQRAIIRAETADDAWSAWVYGSQSRLFTAHMSLDQSRERGVPVLEVRSFEEKTGRVISSGWFMLTNRGDWSRCNE